MKKILYFSVVPWVWIKQRPHFIAEGLAKEFVVDYYAEVGINSKNYIKNEASTKNLSLKRLFKLPLIKWYSGINNFLVQIQLKRKLKYYDILWINGRCEIFNNFFGAKTKNIKIIYDCLDNQIEFPVAQQNEILRTSILSGEKAIVENADIIFCSSDTLKQVITKRYEIEKNIHVINNGIKLNTDIRIKDVPSINDSKKKIITYIGTISGWFDFKLLQMVCEKFSQIEFHLYGPLEVIIPFNKQIKYLGILEHKDVFNVMSKADAMIMPFKINELIKSVNPVKLYEYIYSGKIVIAIRYYETEKFGNYVHLYDNSNSFLEICKKVVDGTVTSKANLLDAQNFCKENTWEKRVNDIVHLLK
jgi:glycosyltransferase involved in cell wall biosynthesis